MRIVRGKKVGANLWFHRRENVAIDKIKKIDREKERERAAAAGGGTVFRFHRQLRIGR